MQRLYRALQQRLTVYVQQLSAAEDPGPPSPRRGLGFQSPTLRPSSGQSRPPPNSTRDGPERASRD